MRLALLLTPLLAACGYHAVDAGRVFGPEVRRIEIRPFENESLESGFERLVADSLIEEFGRRGVLEPVYDGSGAPDLVLHGTVTDLRTLPSAFSSVALTVEDSLTVELDVVVVRVSNHKSVWHRKGMSFVERFLSSPDSQVYESNKEQALRRLSAEIAARIHDELFQKF